MPAVEVNYDWQRTSTTVLTLEEMFNEVLNTEYGTISIVIIPCKKHTRHIGEVISIH